MIFSDKKPLFHTNENLTMTMITGQNPFAEGETQLQMTRSYG